MQPHFPFDPEHPLRNGQSTLSGIKGGEKFTKDRCSSLIAESLAGPKQILEINIHFTGIQQQRTKNRGDMSPTADSSFFGILNELQFLRRRQPRKTEAFIINSSSCFEAQ